MAGGTVALTRNILARADDAPIVVLDAHARPARSVVWAPDGGAMFTCGEDGCVRSWKPPGFRPLGTLEGHTKSVNTLAVSTNSHLLASGSSDGTVRLWLWAERRLLRVLPGQVAAAFSPDGRYIATITGKCGVALWDVNSGAQQWVLSKFDTRLFCIACAPDGRHLLVGGTGAIHRIALDDPTARIAMKGHGAYVAALRFSPQGDMLASTGGEGALRVWSTADWRVVNCIPLRGKGALSLAWEPHGRVVAVGIERGIELIAMPDGEASERIDVSPFEDVRSRHGVNGLAFSPNGRYLACAGADGGVRIWATRLPKIREWRMTSDESNNQNGHSTIVTRQSSLVN